MLQSYRSIDLCIPICAVSCVCKVSVHLVTVGMCGVVCKV